MARKVNQILWDQWQQRIERQRESGLSIVAFCEQEHVSPHRFHAWKRKFRPTASAQQASVGLAQRQRFRKQGATAMPLRRHRRGTATSATSQRPMEFLQLPLTAAQGSPWIELALADGTILRLPQQNLAALVTALRVLRGERLELSCGDGGHA